MGSTINAELGFVTTAKDENKPKIQNDLDLKGDSTGNIKNETKNNPFINPLVIVVMISYSIGIKTGIKRNKYAEMMCFFLNNPNAKTTKGKIPIHAVVMGKA